MSYASRLRAEQLNKEIGHWPKDGRVPPGWLLDRIAEEKLSGGYKIRPNRKGVVRNPVCPNCFVAKALNGGCTCTE